MAEYKEEKKERGFFGFELPDFGKMMPSFDFGFGFDDEEEKKKPKEDDDKKETTEEV